LILLFKIHDKLVKVKAIDKYTVEFTTPHPFASLLTSLSQTPIFPKHIFAAIIARNNFRTSYSLNSAPKNIVGSGPFVVERVISKKTLTFRKNVYYFKKDKDNNKLPYLDRVKIHIEKDSTVRFLRFLSGEEEIYEFKGKVFKQRDFNFFQLPYKLVRLYLLTVLCQL